MVEPTQVDEWTPLVIEKLTEKLGSVANKDKLCELLRNTGSVLSGGFVLNAIVNYEKNLDFMDMDIYVPCENVPLFLITIVTQKVYPPNVHTYGFQNSSLYCRSFLRKNGIRRVHTFFEYRGVMDIMSLRKSTTPVKVCSNFDLTMCQVWFDGTTVFATHPDHIREKRGYLQNDYINTFIEGNQFLRRRLTKYKNRGFTIEYDPTFTSSYPSINDILTNKACMPLQMDLEHWFKRIITIWLTERNKKSLERLPFMKRRNGKSLRIPINEVVVEHDAGYDSEDMDKDKFSKLSVDIPLDGEVDVPLDGEIGDVAPELKLGRSLFEFVKQSLGTAPTVYSKHLGYNLTSAILELNEAKHRYEDLIIQVRAGPPGVLRERRIKTYELQIERIIPKIEKYTKMTEYLKDQCTREGTDFAYDEGRVYDLHEHPIDQGTTRDSMEGYLNQFLQLPDKLDGVPCYYKPGIGAAQAHLNCPLKITLDDIRIIVSPEYFEKFSKPSPIKTGLNTVMPLYELALPNTKVLAAGFGDEYSESMCPFCLQPITRGEGCSYMTHENPQRLDGSLTPFCQKEFVVQSVLDKYRRWANKIRPTYPLHIEFCVECGRPCNGHQHFDLTSTDDNPKMLAETTRRDADGRLVHDYAACPGGGRPELFARILAVRDIYANAGIMDPKLERETAAVAADAAASDPAYLARGAAIFAKDKDARKFNVEVPVTKPYDDPAYAVANAVANSNTNSNFDELEGGGRKSRYPNKTIRKRNRGTRTTRSHM